MKKLNVSLLKAIIETDFLLLSSSKVSKKKLLLRSSDFIIKSSSTFNNTTSLDIVELIKGLKQTIRLLQFIKSNELNSLQICVSNKQHLNILNSYFKQFSFNNTVKFSSNLVRFNNTKEDVSQLLLLLEDSLGNNKKVFRRLFEDKIFLINKINSKVEVNNWSTYKIYNDFSDLKKLIFLIVLLRQTL